MLKAGMDALAAALERSPELFPHSLDVARDSVNFIRLRREEFAEASFLDDRMLRPGMLNRSIPWSELESRLALIALPRRRHFIFHIGHVGSTLLSRLLGTYERLFALREPAILREFARRQGAPHQAHSDSVLLNREGLILNLLSRTFAPTQTALIKATSFVSERAADWLSGPSESRALLLHVSPEAYMATILAGPNSRVEARQMTADRMARLRRRLGLELGALDRLSEGEALALGWAAEMTALIAAREAAGERARMLDFDRFLAAPETELQAAFRHFGCDVDEQAVTTAIRSPLMERYAKAPEHAYSPALRVQLLDEARDLHRDEIAKGLAWLEALAQRAPDVCATLAPVS
jgi:hypothetical protein